MKLSEILTVLMNIKSWNQTEIGAVIGRTQGQVSELLSTRSKVEENWDMFLKVLRLCANEKIDPAGPAPKTMPPLLDKKTLPVGGLYAIYEDTFGRTRVAEDPPTANPKRESKNEARNVKPITAGRTARRKKSKTS